MLFILNNFSILLNHSLEIGYFIDDPNILNFLNTVHFLKREIIISGLWLLILNRFLTINTHRVFGLIMMMTIVFSGNFFRSLFHLSLLVNIMSCLVNIFTLREECIKFLLQCKLTFVRWCSGSLLTASLFFFVLTIISSI